jgi:hypothetical protein
LNRDPNNRTQLSDPPELRKSASGKDTRELEEAIMATQLDRLPSIFRKVFEIKSRGDDYVPERPKDGPLPKYWNNVPKTDEAQVHAFHEMAHMKQECKKHKEQIKQEQVDILFFIFTTWTCLTYWPVVERGRGNLTRVISILFAAEN